MTDLLSQLNPDQKAAVLHGSGPAIVLAGAGSGKTKVLTTRAAHLIRERGVSVDAILLVTFTNKAAQEMNKRLEQLVGSRLPMSGTFHRLCAKILRKDGESIGIPRSFVIFDDDDQLELIKSILERLKLHPKEFAPRSLLSMISGAKNELISPTVYKQIARGKYQEVAAMVYELYEQGLRENSAVDFDNILNKTLELLQKNSTVLQRYQQLFDHVMVDEYQDVNKAQYRLTKLFAAPENNLFCVGDFSQNIYGWRGADYRNMLQLKVDYADLAEYKLQQNYRSTQTILDAAGSVIKNNKSHPVLSLWTEKTETQPIQLYEAETEKHEVELVVREIQRLQRTTPLSEMAVLYRTNAQSRVIEEACLRASIPYKLVGGVRFYSRKEIKDVLCLLRLVANAQDAIALKRVRKLGKRKSVQFEMWLEDERVQLLTVSTSEIFDQVLEQSQYLESYDDRIEEDASRLENIRELRSVAQDFPELSDFLENVALVDAEDAGGKSVSDQETERLTLMSIHAAKGLEFHAVFLIGMEEGLFPHSRSLLDRQQLEEERRLCYVAITRAKEYLFLSYTRRRLLYGSVTGSIVSRFIAEIPVDLLQRKNGLDVGWSTPYIASVQRVQNDPSLDRLLQGDMDIDTFLNS